jgi:hypothetical protein
MAWQAASSGAISKALRAAASASAGLASRKHKRDVLSKSAREAVARLSLTINSPRGCAAAPRVRAPRLVRCAAVRVAVGEGKCRVSFAVKLLAWHNYICHIRGPAHGRFRARWRNSDFSRDAPRSCLAYFRAMRDAGCSESVV